MIYAEIAPGAETVINADGWRVSGVNQGPRTVVIYDDENAPEGVSWSATMLPYRPANQLVLQGVCVFREENQPHHLGIGLRAVAP